MYWQLFFWNFKRREKKKTGTFDPQYVLRFNETYLLTGSIEKTLKQLEEQYEDNPIHAGTDWESPCIFKR